MTKGVSFAYILGLFCLYTFVREERHSVGQIVGGQWTLVTPSRSALYNFVFLKKINDFLILIWGLMYLEDEWTLVVMAW
jgi:hypothetical protein